MPEEMNQYDASAEEEVEVKRDMSFFMKGKGEDVKTRKIKVTERFRDEKDKVIPFLMKSISTTRINELEDECQVDNFVKGKRVGKKLDAPRFYARVGVESTVYPDFRDANLRKSYGTQDPVNIAKEVLSVPGEYAAWIAAVLEINELDNEFEELVDEAKN